MAAPILIGATDRRDTVYPESDPAVRACHLEAMPAAVMRVTIPPDRIAGWLPKAYRMVGAWLAREGIAVAGPAFARYTSSGPVVEVEAGYPVAVAVGGNGIVVPSGLPGGPAAITVHEGPLGALDGAYRRIEAWLGGNGFTAQGRHWERYLVGGVTNETDPNRWRTEVVVPYGWQRWVPTGSAGGRVVAAARPPRTFVVAGTEVPG